MDIDDAKLLEEAKAILKDMDPSPDPKKEQIEIWKGMVSQDGRRPACLPDPGHR